MAERLIKNLRGDAPYGVGDSVALDGSRFTNYQLSGPEDAQLVVCFHGLNASMTQFSTLVSVLTMRGFRVLRFDLYGHGMSSNIPTELLHPKFTLVDLYLQQTEFLLKHLSLWHHAHHVVGFSMGGFIAMEHTRHNHVWVDKLILLSPAGFIPSQPWHIRLVKSNWTKGSVFALAKAVHKLACTFARNQKMLDYYKSWPPTDLPPGSEVPDWKQISYRNLGSVLNIASALPLWDHMVTFADLATLDPDRPIFFGWGQDDTMTPPSEQVKTEVGRHVRAFVWKVYPDARHHILEDAYPRVFFDVCRFLKSIPPKVSKPRCVATDSPICPTTPDEWSTTSTTSPGVSSSWNTDGTNATYEAPGSGTSEIHATNLLPPKTRKGTDQTEGGGHPNNNDANEPVLGLHDNNHVHDWKENNEESHEAESEGAVSHGDSLWFVSDMDNSESDGDEVLGELVVTPCRQVSPGSATLSSSWVSPGERSDQCGPPKRFISTACGTGSGDRLPSILACGSDDQSSLVQMRIDHFEALSASRR